MGRPAHLFKLEKRIEMLSDGEVGPYHHAAQHVDPN
jgi:hypothetical protein